MFDAHWWLDKLFLAPGILFGLVIHEFFHGYAAYKMGDPTAKWAGRLSLNPLKHLDLVGTAFLFFFRFGWAKPVPVDARNFRNPRAGIVVTSVAGPASNFALALVTAALLGLIVRPAVNAPGAFDSFWVRLAFAVLFNAVYINVVLGIFNLLPIPPLDGSNVIYGLLPAPAARKYGSFMVRYGRYALLIFVLLLILGPEVGLATGKWLTFIIVPPVDILMRAFTGVGLGELWYSYETMMVA